MTERNDIPAQFDPLVVVSWPAHCVAQRREHERADRAAERLLEGDDGPARGLLGRWAFADKLTWCRSVLAALLERPPLLSTLDPSRWRAPDPELELPRQARFLHRRRAWSAASRADGPALKGRDATAWGLETLSWVGARIDMEERLAWSAPTKEAPESDARCLSVWSSLVSGDVWSVHGALSGRWAQAATRGFQAGLRARGVPESARGPYVSEFREAVLFYLLGAKGEAPGWHDVAARTLEWTGPSAISSLGAHLTATGWQRAIACPKSQTPAWRAVRARVAGDLANVLAEQWALEEAARTGALPLEAVLDLLIALRLTTAWSETEAPPPSPDRLWAVVLHHRHRTRGRLRALVSDSMGQIVDAFSGLEGLEARTQRSLRQFGWARACEVVRGHGLPDWASPVTPACSASVNWEPRLGADERAMVESWILLCVLRGRRRELEHWGRTGQWLKRPDSGWGRLLQEGLPVSLIGKDSGYRRVLAHLSLNLGAHLRSLAGRARRLSQLPDSRALKAELAADWHPCVPLPSRLSQRAREALSEAAAAWARQPEPRDDPETL